MNDENLRPVKTKKEARERGHKGGIASGVAKREKKLMSQIYADFLSRKYKVNKDGTQTEVAGAEVITEVIKDIIMRRDSATVSLMKEIREATEGSKIDLSGAITVKFDSDDSEL